MDEKLHVHNSFSRTEYFTPRIKNKFFNPESAQRKSTTHTNDLVMTPELQNTKYAFSSQLTVPSGVSIFPVKSILDRSVDLHNQSIVKQASIQELEHQDHGHPLYKAYVKNKRLKLLQTQHKADFVKALNEMSKRSFIIKEIKPEQRLSAIRQKASPKEGRRSSSYYQMVAVQKNFRASRYFDSQHSPHFLGCSNENLKNRYHSRITSQPELKRPRKISNYGLFEEGFIEPWRQEDPQSVHLHHRKKIQLFK